MSRNRLACSIKSFNEQDITNSLFVIVADVLMDNGIGIGIGIGIGFESLVLNSSCGNRECERYSSLLGKSYEFPHLEKSDHKEAIGSAKQFFPPDRTVFPVYKIMPVKFSSPTRSCIQ